MFDKQLRYFNVWLLKVSSGSKVKMIRIGCNNRYTRHRKKIVFELKVKSSKYIWFTNAFAFNLFAVRLQHPVSWPSMLIQLQLFLSINTPNYTAYFSNLSNFWKVLFRTQHSQNVPKTSVTNTPPTWMLT